MREKGERGLGEKGIDEREENRSTKGEKGREIASLTDELCTRSISKCMSVAPNPGPTTQPQPAIDHYNDVSTFHNDDFCDAPRPMLCVGCLELTIPKTVLNRTLLQFLPRDAMQSGTSHGPVSVCLCLSQVGVLLKRLNTGSHKQHHTIAHGL